jgi:hypothetical protein
MSLTATLRSTGFVVVSVLFLFLSSSPGRTALQAPQPSSQEGLQLLRKMQVALGGAEKIAAIQDYEETVRAQVWNNSGVLMGEVRKRTRWMRRPNLLRLDQVGPRSTYVLYFDGDSGSGWEILPDMKSAERFKTTGKPVELVGGELKFAENYLSGFIFNLWLADRNPAYRLTSPAQNVLRMEHDGTAGDVFLDPITSLPIKTTGVSLADPDHPVPSEMHSGGWTEVAGVRFPTQRTNYHSGVKMAEEKSGIIRINTGLKPENLAAKPADSAPDIPNC